MVTATDDISARIAAVEADIRNINTQLERMHDAQQANQASHQADMRALNARIDNLNSRIDRVFWAVIGIGSGIIVAIVGVGIAAVI